MIRRKKVAKQDKLVPAVAMLEPGKPAPDLTLPATTDELISLADFRGRPVVLVFYPADFSPVCGDQLVLYNEVLPLFEQHDAVLLPISVDGIWCHKAFAESRKLRFPLLSDYEPKGAVARAFGVYDADKGRAQRALFVVDAGGLIHWGYVSPSNVNPGADGILRALESLET